MSEKVRVGIIGTSPWTDRMHLANLNSHPQTDLVAICGRTPERAEEVAEKYKIPHVFGDYREMIREADLQALVVVAPDDLHYSMTMEGLEASLHVICEKPLAANSDQAKEMYEKAEGKGVKHMTFFTYRWVAHYQYLKHLVDEGYIGQCHHIHLHYMAGSNRTATRYKWRYDRKRANGVLGDLGSHMIDMARWLLDDIVKVNAHLNVFSRLPGSGHQPLDPANDSAILCLEFKNGTQGVIHASNVAHTGDRGQTHDLTLHGESGSLEAHFSLNKGTEIQGIQHGDKQFTLLPIPESILGDVDQTQPVLSQIGETFTAQSVADRLFIDAILEDKPVFPSFYEGLKVQEVIDAAVDSHENKSWISLG